jgi:acyl-CoA synthetase (AMP-forming)/AMP-acid ligase II
MKSFKELLLWAEANHGGKDAIIDLDRGARWTYADLNAAARSACAGYAAGGIRQGDRVGWLAMAPGTDITALSFGARKMGAIPVAMNGRAAPEQLAWMIGNVGVKALSYTAESAAMLERLREIGIPSVEQFIAIDEPADPGHVTLASIYADHAAAGEPDADIAPDDVALVIYTSGSTGRPKPVMHTEAEWMHTTMNIAYANLLYFEDRYLNIFPPHFAGWAHVTTGCIRAAAGQVCMRFTPAELARAIVDERCTHVILTPTMVRMLRDQEEKTPGLLEGNAVRCIQLGGEAATDEVLKIVHRFFPDAGRVASHGATEAVTLSTGPANPRLASGGALLGRPLPGVTVEIRDEETGAVITEPGVPGGMYVTGPVAAGIWGDAEATTANFPGGWWRSGDVVQRDAEGYYYIGGRTDNVFKSGAIKVQCEEVEATLKEHPLVLDVLVVPVPDDTFGQVGHAFVRHSQPLTGDELDAWWRQRPDAAAYARPRHWTLCGEAPFPMVTAAKVDRQAIRRRAAELHQPAAG